MFCQEKGSTSPGDTTKISFRSWWPNRQDGQLSTEILGLAWWFSQGFASITGPGAWRWENMGFWWENEPLFIDHISLHICKTWVQWSTWWTIVFIPRNFWIYPIQEGPIGHLSNRGQVPSACGSSMLMLFSHLAPASLGLPKGLALPKCQKNWTKIDPGNGGFPKNRCIFRVLVMTFLKTGDVFSPGPKVWPAILMTSDGCLSGAGLSEKQLPIDGQKHSKSLAKYHGLPKFSENNPLNGDKKHQNCYVWRCKWLNGDYCKLRTGNLKWGKLNWALLLWEGGYFLFLVFFFAFEAILPSFGSCIQSWSYCCLIWSDLFYLCIYELQFKTWHFFHAKVQRQFSPHRLLNGVRSALYADRVKQTKIQRQTENQTQVLYNTN